LKLLFSSPILFQMTTAPSLGLAFLMGMLSFLTPCVLPLVPAYISFISGYSVGELRSQERDKDVTFKVLVSAIFFVLGFSLIFVLLGASASVLGQVMARFKPILVRLAGLVVIFFGLQLAGIIKFLPLLKERRYQGEIRAVGPAKAFIFGLAFAFGWTPCIGPILGSILMLAINQGEVLRGTILLAGYSLGLAIPFLLTAVLIDRFFQFSSRIKKHFRKIELAGGIILILVGLLMVINRFDLLKYYLERILPSSILKWG